MLANGILQGIPTTLDVKGLELNISLAGACLTCPVIVQLKMQVSVLQACQDHYKVLPG